MPATVAAAAYTRKTAWARHLAAPVREFVEAETSSAVVLLAATVAALVWANVDSSSYASVWSSQVELRLSDWVLELDLRDLVNDGLLAFFFFVVGLEARREFDMGELRERKRIALPVFAGVGGMIVPVVIFLAITAGGDAAHGWGTAMSTDTAFALGVLAVVARRSPDRLRVFMLTVAVVDDVLALVVIATVYSESIDAAALAIGAAIFLVILAVRYSGLRRGVPYAVLGAATWVALFESGVDPVVVGLAMGLLTSAYPASRQQLERATNLFRSFREQPTPELARTAQRGLEYAISPNERLQGLFHPWTSYLIVPLFALANAGIPLDPDFLRQAATSQLTLAIVLGSVLGKPLGIVLISLLAVRLERGRLRLPVPVPTLAGGGAVAGIGFTVALLVADRAFTGVELRDAKAGVLAAAVLSAITGWLVFQAGALIPKERKALALANTAEAIIDLVVPVDPERDHIRGPDDAPVTLVEYGDFECPYCGQAERSVRELLAEFGDDLRYVWRNLPLADVHPRAQLAAEAAEAAAAQGRFWEMYEHLLTHQDELRPSDLWEAADRLGLDRDRFSDEIRRHVYAGRIAEDVDGADLSSVSGTPTFFVNGLRHLAAHHAPTRAVGVPPAPRRALARRAAAVQPGV
jgi:Na+/H+ antiporter NhaA